MKRSNCILAVALVLAMPWESVPGQRLSAQELDFDLHETFEVMWAEYYAAPAEQLDVANGLDWDDDDVSVAFFLSYHSGRPFEDVVDLRRRGLSWIKVSAELGLTPKVFYVEVPPDVHVGPPYGKAFEYYRRRTPEYVLVDDDVKNLVHLRVTSDYYGLEPLEVIRDRERGHSFARLIETHHGKSMGRNARGGAVTHEHPHKPDRPDRPDRPDKPGKPDKPDKPGKPDKPDKPGHGHGDHGGRP